MSSMVLDASALLALMNAEPGADAVAAAIPDGVISAVNLSEVVAKLTESAIDPSEAWNAATRVAPRVVDFDSTMAREAAALRPATRALGLGFGDRACLALALVRRLPVLTADRQWSALSLGLQIHFMRP